MLPREVSEQLTDPQVFRTSFEESLKKNQARIRLMTRLAWISAGPFLLFLAASACAQSRQPSESTASDSTQPADAVYTYGDASRDGIGKFYMGREISHVMGHRGRAWLERPERVEEERTDRLLELLPLESGDVVVADHRRGQRRT